MRRILFLLVSTCLMCLAACDSSTEPETPTLGGPGEIPPVPKPASLDDEGPMTSDTLRAIVPNQADFVATAINGTGQWQLEQRTERCEFSIRGYEWVGKGTNKVYKDFVDSRNITVWGFKLSDVLWRWRASYASQGKIIKPEFVSIRIPQQTLNEFPPDLREQATEAFNEEIKKKGYLGIGAWDEHGRHGLGKVCSFSTWHTHQKEYQYYLKTGVRITNPVYVYRERFWVRVPVDGESAMRAEVTSGTTFSVATSYTQGVSVAESRSFTETMSVSLSVGSKKVGVVETLGESLSQTFGTTVKTTEQKTVTVTETVTGVPDKVRVLMIWALVERYTFVDPEGNPYTDPAYEFEPFGEAVIQGTALRLDTTDFDVQ